ncbi:MAG TPA: disulfide oxidoreductase [Patescibacteria group bacterium]|nr:disulfide oxidoreductase [Patescibacteria group bacterium]
MDKSSALIIVGGFADLVLLGEVILVALILVLGAHLVFKKNKFLKKIISFFSENALIFAFFVALAAMTGSLFFSEVAKFVPCKLCWYQRICMYPQVLILGIAALKNDFSIKRYILPLSIVGIIISTYHYILQMSPLPLPCTDEIASCAAKQAAFFGYMTIPLMAWTAFAMIILLMLLIKRKK